MVFVLFLGHLICVVIIYVVNMIIRCHCDFFHHIIVCMVITLFLRIFFAAYNL